MQDLSVDQASSGKQEEGEKSETWGVTTYEE